MRISTYLCNNRFIFLNEKQETESRANTGFAPTMRVLAVGMNLVFICEIFFKPFPTSGGDSMNYIAKESGGKYFEGIDKIDFGVKHKKVGQVEHLTLAWQKKLNHYYVVIDPEEPFCVYNRINP